MKTIIILLIASVIFGQSNKEKLEAMKHKAKYVLTADSVLIVSQNDFTEVYSNNVVVTANDTTELKLKIKGWKKSKVHDKIRKKLKEKKQ